MRRAPLILSVGFALLLLCAPAAMAMGFGRTVTATTLGEPLNFVAYLALDIDETLARECVTADVTVGENRLAGENVRVTLEPARDSGERRVRVTTRTVIDEPIVAVNVIVGCRSRMSRRFVAFVDPPMLRLASAEPEESVPAQRIDPRVATLVDIVRAADASRQSADRDGSAGSTASTSEVRRTPRRPAPGRRFAALPAERTISATPARVASARKASRPVPSGGRDAGATRAAPRLRLDPAQTFAAAPTRPAEAVAPRAPAPPSAAPNESAVAAALAAAALAPPTPASAGAAVSSAAAVAAERSRLQELESGLARLRSESQAQQKTLATLQARLRQAESDRYANGLVYALAAGLVFFALLAVAFWALRPRQRRRARWFDAQASQQRRAAAAAPATPAPRPTADAGSPVVSQHPSQWSESGASILPVTAPATIGGLEVTTVLAPQPHYARRSEMAESANGALASPLRSSSPSMEELIDLEQQAEFFVVLGQDEAAIALLTAHLRDTGGASPLPFLQLLEIHQRRGDRDSYEEVRLGYRKQFHAFAPEWSSDLHFGRSLEDYPQAVARLQALWQTPLHAMHTLDGLLFRRQEADEAFDFPAYRELLFLYSIARELAGQVETDFGTIDLFLPLEDTPVATSARDDSPFAVDLDITSWPDGSSRDGPVIRRSVGWRGAS